MSSLYKLSQNQKKILNALEEYLSENKYAPTLRELSGITGIKSISSIHNILCVLEGHGLIEIRHGKNRAIVLKNGIVCKNCKECKHSKVMNNYFTIRRYCSKLCRNVNDDFYCAYLEVRSNDSTR